MTRRLPVLALLLALAVELVPRPARAQAFDADEGNILAAVQKRRFRMDHELFFSAAFLPWDAFYKGIAAEAGYSYHFNDLWSWEVARFGYSYNVDTGLKRDLESNFGVAPTQFDQVQYFLSSDLVFSPLYGKMSLLNRSVVHNEAYALFGGALVRMTSGFRPAPLVGAGVRFYFSPGISLRFEARYALAVSDKLKSIFFIQPTVALGFGAD